MTGHDAQNTASTAMTLEKRRLLQNFPKEYLCNELRYCFPWQPSGGGALISQGQGMQAY